MSLLCRRLLPRRLRRAGTPHLWAVLTLLAGTSVDAAEIYFQPLARVSVDVDSNRDLVTTGPKTTSEGYNGEIGGLWNINTPQSSTTIRPRVGYSDVPRVHERAFLGIADLYSQYRFERGEVGFLGQFDRRDTYTSELAAPTFNTVIPNLPTTPETGRINVSSTRTLGTLVPTYTYELTQRLSWAVTGTYQDVDYGGTHADQYVPFRYYLGGTSLGWAATTRLGTSFGVYGSREAAKDGSGSVNGGGAKISFDYKWSQLFTAHLDLFAEHDSSRAVRPIAANDASTGGGGTFSTSWKGEISQVRLSVGRTFTPTGAGSKFAADHAQVEYSRDLSRRLSFSTAAIYNRYVALSGVYRGSNYSYVNSTASLKWRLTPTWYISGGGSYIWTKFGQSVGAANNEMLYIAVGYEGLRRPQ